MACTRRSKPFVLVLIIILAALVFLYSHTPSVREANKISKYSDGSFRQQLEGEPTDSSLREMKVSHLVTHTAGVARGQSTGHVPHSTTTGLPNAAHLTRSAADGTILEDLERCSKALGITELSLVKNMANIVEVGRRAELFLTKVALLLPGNFSKEYKNPCWVTEKPNAHPGWEEGLMSYFHPQSGKKPRIRGDSFAQFLSKPVDEKYTKSKRLICLPYFFLAGFPKCATTTVHSVLGRYPHIIQPSEKEPHYWPRTLRLSKLPAFDVEYVPISFMSYTLFFRSLTSRLTESSDPTTALDLITYDGSQSTLWDSNFFFKEQEYCAMPAVISRVLPNAKFIVVMRNPVTRLYSHFMFSCLIHYGKVQNWPRPVQENGVDIFHTQVMKEITSFNKCVEDMSVFECVSLWTARRTSKAEIAKGAKFNCGGIFHRLTIGLYAVHILKWLQFYPKENFLFLRTEDLSRTPTEIMSRITEFLGVSPVSEQMARDMFGQHTNVFNASSNHLLPMDEQTRLSLEEFYRPYNEELAMITNDDRFLWNDLQESYKYRYN